MPGLVTCYVKANASGVTVVSARATARVSVSHLRVAVHTGTAHRRCPSITHVLAI